MTPDSEYVRCPHGLMRRGWCFHCKQEQPIRWLDHIERPLSRIAWLGLLLAAIYVGAHAAISF